MVETIGQMSVSGERSVIRAAPVAPTQAVATPVQTQAQTAPPTQPAVTSQATSVAQQLSAEAPVDMERVSKIKRAIADGSFPILPSTIADRLLALRLEWSPNEKA